MKSTVVKPSNGQAKNRSKAKGQSSGSGLRRLTKRQREKIYRIFTIIFLLVFAVSIVGTLVAVSMKAPAGH